jgi:hypothetical protein
VVTKKQKPTEKIKENGKTGIFIHRCLSFETNLFAKNGMEWNVLV